MADDHDDTRQVLTAILTKAGHEVLTAADGTEAMAGYREQRPDLVILDIFMVSRLEDHRDR